MGLYKPHLAGEGPPILQRAFDELFGMNSQCERRLLGLGVPGRAVMDDCLGRARWLVESELPFIRLTQPLPQFYVDYVANFALNAASGCTDATPDTEYIGIFYGVPQRLLAYFGRVLSHPELLPFVGDPSRERPDLTWIPNDPARAVHALLLTRLSLDSLVLHEMAHLVYGHVAYLRRHYRRNALVELEDEQLGEDEIITRQTLEMDADSLAACRGLDHALMRAREPERLKPEWREIATSLKTSVAAWAFAMNSVFLLLDRSRIDFHALSAHAHPQPRHRLCMATVSALGHITDVPENNRRAEIKEAIAIGSLQAELVFAKLTDTPIADVLSDTETMFDPRAWAHTQILLDKWQDIKPDLQTLARTQLAD